MRSLWLPSFTDVHRSIMHARPAARRASLALPLLARAMLVLICALLLARAMLRACVCYALYARPPHWNHLRLMKHLQHGGLTETYV